MKDSTMDSTKTVNSTRPITGWEKNLIGWKIEEIPRLLPGLVLTIGFAWVSIWLSEYIGVNILGFAKTPISAVIVVLLLGLGIGNALSLPKGLEHGFTFAIKKVLRLGIILLGIRLSIFDVFKLGAMGVPIVLLCILSALLFTTALNRWLKLPERLGTLVAIGTSICGVSAIVAAAPAIDAKDEEVSYAVAVITVFGIIATFVYPYAAYHVFAGDAVKSGLFLGTSVHETAQVTGAAMIFSEVHSLPLGLDVATVTKMVRNVFMAFVIPLMALYYSRRKTDKQMVTETQTSISKLFPLFIVGFLTCALIRSIGDAGIEAGGSAFGLWPSAAWKDIHSGINHWAANLLVIALAGVGLNTRFHVLKELGLKPFIVGLGAALVVGLVSFVAIAILGAFVTY
jgi:uncharacterized integral membrane protein (TIGR00698 family)